MGFLLLNAGFIVGVIIIAVLSRTGVRKSRWFGLLMGAAPAPAKSGGTTEFFSDALKELRREDKTLADAIENNASAEVAVEDQPSELPTEVFENVMTARTDEEAERQVKATIVDRDVRDVVIALVRWKPPAHLESEQEYEASFVRSLAKRGITKDKIQLKERITWSADDRHGGGSRVGIPDLIVKNKVLVELKANLSGAEAADRAMGQMLRYLLAWKGRGPAVLAVCGESSPEIRFLIRTYMKIWRDTLRLPVTVVFRRSDERVSYEPGENPA